MLTGRPLFRGDDVNEILTKNQNCDLDFPARFWDKISAEAKDLTLGMLKKDPKERLTAAQALEHSWFKIEMSEERIIETQNFKFRELAEEKSSG